MDPEVQKYLLAILAAIVTSLITYLLTRKKVDAETKKVETESAKVLIDAAVQLVDSYEKRIKNLETEVIDLKLAHKELMAVNTVIIDENKSLRKEVVRLETILYNKGDMDS